MENRSLDATTATVFNIQKFCTDDGPGIRTTVFLKGCHLRCAWCHNPEGLSSLPVLEYSAVDCASCRRCESLCPNGVHSFADGIHQIDRSRCVSCGACVAGCGYGALSFCGKAMTAQQVLDIALADRLFYEPEGGITVSGGEPLLQPDFVLALGLLAKAQGIHVCVETSGAVPFSVIEKVLPAVDLFLFDIKETDPQNHLRYVGISRELPLSNLKALGDRKIPLVIRCPIVPGVNDRPDHFEALAKLYTSIPSAAGIQLMPYHRLGQGKTTRFGAQSESFTVPTAPQTAGWNQMLSEAIARLKGEQKKGGTP